MSRRYKQIGLAAILWTDACWMIRVRCLEDVEPLHQQSIGYVWLDKKQGGYIVIHNITENGTDMELTYIPAAWVQEVTPLEEKVSRRAKPRTAQLPTKAP